MRPTHLLLFLSLSSSVFSQSWNDRIQTLSRLGKPPVDDYRIGPGDLLEIAVFGEEKLSRTLRVSSSGTITLPFLDAINVNAMTALELEEQLETRLDGVVIHNPQVSVFVKEYRSQPVFVLGAVERPGEYQMSRQLRLIDAIAMAGGLKLEKAADQAVIQRSRIDEATGSSQPEAIKISLKDLLDNSVATLNVPLLPGDVIQIPERVDDLFYVVGEVNRPGAFALPRNQQLLLSQALAWAGGTQKTAKADKGLLVRYENGQRREMAINFTDIIKGKQPDVEIKPSDVVFIPGSKIKTLGYGLLGTIPGTVQGAVIYGPIR
ncbi:MAG: polysaccharide biosynthesis/export family protein [Acidobacteriota bacterium]